MKHILLIGILLSSSAFATVWSGTKQWNSQWEAEYSNWVATKAGPNFFKELGSPYAELGLDCADVHYGLLAYFSRMHGLAFSVNRGKVSNLTTRFDKYSGERKMSEFIKFLAGSYGTESLAHNDTIPVGIRSVRPGDIFMYKVGTSGNYTRHTYIIKGINVDGTFDVMYSTQQRAKEKKPLRRRTSYDFKKAPLNTGVDKNHWGFKRQKMPHQMSISQEALGADFSQYSKARELGRLEFFRYVKRVHKTVNESAGRVIKRNFDGYCSEVQDRVGAVQAGLRALAAIGNRCMNFSEYDANSTPSRDSGIKDTIRNYTHDFQNIYNAGDFQKVEPGMASATLALFVEGALNSTEKAKLKALCPVNTSIGSLDIGSFKYNLMANRVSFHPNDNKYRRWGVQEGSATRCEAFYGYPN